MHWVCPPLGIKGVRCSHSGIGWEGGVWGEEGGRGCCDIHTTRMVAVKQVGTWSELYCPTYPVLCVYKHTVKLYYNRNTAVQYKYSDWPPPTKLGNYQERWLFASAWCMSWVNDNKCFFMFQWWRWGVSGLVQQRVTGCCPVTQSSVNQLTHPVCVAIKWVFLHQEEEK